MSTSATADVPPTGPFLVTGGTGFAGRHLVARLAKTGTIVHAPTRAELDLSDADAVRAWVGRATPAAIFHLAAFSSPSRSLDQPVETLLGNLRMTLNILEAVRGAACAAPVVLVGSAQVYGNPVELPVSEEAPLRPRNPYAASKACCEMLGRQYAAAKGIRVVLMRPFNHAGPGQSADYVVGSITRQVAEAELAGAATCVLEIGNADAARDFTDVRDVVDAYALGSESGEGPFNVCSGRAASISEVVELADRSSSLRVRAEVTASRLRSDDASILFGSHDRLTGACGWKPRIQLERTVHDALAWWRERLRADRPAT